MLRFTSIPEGPAGVLRWDRDPQADMPPFHAVATVVWRAPAEVYLLALHGELTRRDMRDLVDWFAAQRIERVLCTRAPGHLLPFARPCTEPGLTAWLEINLADVVGRIGGMRDGA